MHACLNAAPVSGRAGQLLRALAARLLRGALFQRVIHRQGTEPHPARIASRSPPRTPNSSTPTSGSARRASPRAGRARRIVEHLTATGGTPPYRFYIVPEPGGPGVPSWLHLASDGTLTLEPPPGVAPVTLPVEVVDSTGQHSVVFS